MDSLKRDRIVRMILSRASGKWIGVDLDGTLAKYDRWRGPEHIGEPVSIMVLRVKNWLKAGRDVRIFTARIVGPNAYIAKRVIERWCKRYIGVILPITNRKDQNMEILFDDKAVHVGLNTGRIGRIVLSEFEKIKSPAIKDHKGRIHEGENNHSDAYESMLGRYMKVKNWDIGKATEEYLGRYGLPEEGFTTTKGRFIDRD